MISARPEIRAYLGELWSPPERITVSEWADRHIVLPSPGPRPGPWSTTWAPAFREIMDSLAERHVERVTAMTCTQVGKTAALLNAVGYVLHQDPANVMFVLPRDDDARAMCAERLRPLIDESPALAALKTGRKSDWLDDNIGVGTCRVKFVASNSPAGLASRPVRFLFLDEVDKYPLAGVREADPVSLAIERTKNYHDRKVLMSSTPTTRAGLIWREWEASDQRRYHVPCPHCGHWQELAVEHLKWPRGRTADEIAREQLAWYECAGCACKLTEVDKAPMLLHGVWVPAACSIDSDGQVHGDTGSSHRGYTLSTLCSRFVTWSEVGAEFKRSAKDPEKLRNFTNSWRGWIWEERAIQTTAEEVEARTVPTPAGMAPAGTVILTAGVDVQLSGFYYTIRAHAVGERSVTIVADFVESWEVLAAALFERSYPVEGGDSLQVRLACIDSGYRTEEVYKFCWSRSHQARPTKGWDHRQMPIEARKIERDWLGRAHGLALWHLDTTYFKDKLVRQVRNPLGGPSSWGMAAGLPPAFVAHMNSEHKVLERKGSRRTGSVAIAREVWVPKPGAGPNHWWDCEVYNAAAADMLGVYTLQDETSEPAVAAVAARPERDEAARKPFGFGARRGFVRRRGRD